MPIKSSSFKDFFFFFLLLRFNGKFSTRIVCYSAICIIKIYIVQNVKNTTSQVFEIYYLQFTILRLQLSKSNLWKKLSKSKTPLFTIWQVRIQVIVPEFMPIKSPSFMESFPRTNTIFLVSYLLFSVTVGIWVSLGFLYKSLVLLWYFLNWQPQQ